MYEYRGIVTKVYDGDTITVDIDLGFGVWLTGQKMRLGGIDAPEIKGSNKEKGEAARDWLADQILNKEVIIETDKKHKKGKYGRYIVKSLHREFENKMRLDIINRLLYNGHAVRKEY